MMNALRTQGLEARRRMSREDRFAASQLICRHLIYSRLFRASASIACYLPAEDEVDTLPIFDRAWRANKRIFAPVLRKGGKMCFTELRPETTLWKNAYGIWEPRGGDEVAPRRLDLVVAPTVAFDDAHNRIGMGGGYFDRCFAYLRNRKIWLRPKLVGVAFKCQKVEKITPNAWDIPLYRVITEAGRQ